MNRTEGSLPLHASRLLNTSHTRTRHVRNTSPVRHIRYTRHMRYTSRSSRPPAAAAAPGVRARSLKRRSSKPAAVTHGDGARHTEDALKRDYGGAGELLVTPAEETVERLEDLGRHGGLCNGK